MHSIRLRGPWKATWRPDAELLVAVYQRSFNCPTGLQPDQTVWLRLTPPAEARLRPALACRSVAINGVSLSLPEPAAEDGSRSICIEQYLQPFNRLEVELASGDGETIVGLAPEAPLPPFPELFDVAILIED